MKTRLYIIAIASLLCLLMAGTTAQIAGSASLGATVVQRQALVAGWSAKRDLMGKGVINEDKTRIGQIDDLIVAPDNTVSFVIIGVGGFLGVGKSDVAIPVDQLRVQEDGDLLLPGSTKDALKKLPKFEYRKKGSKV